MPPRISESDLRGVLIVNRWIDKQLGQKQRNLKKAFLPFHNGRNDRVAEGFICQTL
jgi:hypothetical protein